MSGPSKQPSSKATGPKGSRKAAKQKSTAQAANEWARAGNRNHPRSAHKILASLNNLFAAEGGTPLSRPLRRKLESQLRQPLPPIKLHTTAQAQQAAMVLGARAFTLGSHIAFSRAVHPASVDGYATLLHEAVHTLQQQNAAPALRSNIDPSSALEQAAQSGAVSIGRLKAQAVQRQVADIGSSPTVRFAHLGGGRYQIIVGGVRIGSVCVTGIDAASGEWFAPVHIVRSDSIGHQVDIGLAHTPGVRVEFSARPQAEVMPLLESRHIFYPEVTNVPVPEGATPEEFGARLLASAERLAHPPLTEMTMEAPEIRVETSEIYRSRPPERTPSAEEEPEREWTVGGMVLQAIMGEWEEDPFISSILLDTGIGLIPIVDQVMDVRDVSAHLYFMIGDEQYTSVMRWIGLVFSLIGAVPEIGTAIKGVSKILIRGGAAALSHLGESVALMQRFLPEGASLVTLRRFIAEHWTEWKFGDIL